jgi:hypothetical protein
MRTERERRSIRRGMTVVAAISEQPYTVANIPVSSWGFAIRVWLATILALFVSFWLQLESPTTAALTVGVLAEPTRGQALDKAVFRLLAPGDEVRFLRAGQRPRAWRT